MARTDNLTNYLKDVADAIREKRQITNEIPANEFDTEIRAISTGGDVKLFDTKEDMLNDTKPVENGKAIVYGNRNLAIKPEQRFTSIYLPEQIVLSKPLTSDITYYNGSESDHDGIGGNSNITPTSWAPRFHLNHSFANAAYKSTDGQTYNRTEFNVEDMGGDSNMDHFEIDGDVLKIVPGTSYTEGYKLFYEVISGDASTFEEFFRQLIPSYEGLYQYIEQSSKFIVHAKSIADNTEKEFWFPEVLDGMTFTGYSDETFEVLDQQNNNKSVMIKSYHTDETGRNIIDSFTMYGYITYQDWVLLTTTNDGKRYLGPRLTSTLSNSYSRMNIVSWDSSNPSNLDVTVLSTVANFNTYWTKVLGQGTSTNDKVYGKDAADSSYYYAPYFNYGALYYLEVASIGSSYTWDYNNKYEYNDKGFMYSLAPTQFTLEEANQLLPGLIALGKNGVVEGDGSIYTSIPFRKLMSERNQDINEISTVYNNQTTVDYKSLLTTSDRTGLVANNTAYYAKAKKIPHVPGYNIVFVTSKYFIYQSTIDYSLAIYNRLTNTKLYDVADMTYIPATAKYTYVNDLGDEVYFITSYASSYKNRLFHFTPTNCTVTILSDVVDDCVCACYMLEDKAFYIETDYTNRKLVVKKVVYSTGTITTFTTLTTITPTDIGYINNIYGNSEKDDTYIYLSANFLHTSQSYVVLVKLSDETVSSTKYTQHTTFARHIDTNALLAWQDNTINSISGTTITKIADVTSTHNDYVMSAMYVPTIGMMSFKAYNGPVATIGTREHLDMAYIFGADSGNAGDSIMTKSELKNGKLIYTGTLTMEEAQYATEVYIDTLTQYNENISDKNNFLNIGDYKTNYVCFLNTPESSGPMSQAEYDQALTTANEIKGGNE